MKLVYIQHFFTYIPIAVFIITCFTFVFRVAASWRWRIAWMVCLLFSCTKFLLFKHIGGDAFYPDFPDYLILFWCWAYSGAIILGVLAFFCFFWKARCKRWLLPLVSWSVSLIGLWNGVSVPDVREVTMWHERLPKELDGYRIALITDIHCSSAAKAWRTKAIVEKANGLNADLICLGGDYADGKAKMLADDMAPIAKLKAKDGVYAVTGNHEYYFDIPGWKEFHRKLGTRILMNECVFPRKQLAFAGVPDIVAARYHRLTPDVGKAFKAATNGEFRVLLQHQPRFAPVNVAKHRVNLQLSGHTHGGIMPLISIMVGNENNGFLRGLYHVEKQLVYVSSGSGQWAGFPMRFFVPSEITLITLRKGVEE